MGRISALTELTSLASNDYLIVLDSSANIAKKITVANAFGIPDIGWTAAGETWAYASATTITVPSDATTKYGVGMVIKLTQTTGGTKYGTIVTVASTLLTIRWRNGATLANETISTPYYSSLATPLGAGPLQPPQWANPYKFSAYKSGGNQATTAGVATKISFQTERFDANSNYDSSTNYRYTIPVTGYYFFNTIVQTLNGTSSTDSNLSIYKNGSLFRKGGNLKNGVYPQHQVVGFGYFVAGDYLEVYFVNISAADSIESGTGTSSTFEAYLITET